MTTITGCPTCGTAVDAGVLQCPHCHAAVGEDRPTRATLGYDLRFLALTICVPVLLVLALSFGLSALGAMFVAPSAPLSVSVAIIVTSFLCLPLFIVAVLRHFREP